MFVAMESIAHMSSCDPEGDSEVHGLVCLAAQLAFEVNIIVHCVYVSVYVMCICKWTTGLRKLAS